jgi:hypothetical protein
MSSVTSVNAQSRLTYPLQPATNSTCYIQGGSNPVYFPHQYNDLSDICGSPKIKQTTNLFSDIDERLQRNSATLREASDEVFARYQRDIAKAVAIKDPFEKAVRMAMAEMMYENNKVEIGLTTIENDNLVKARKIYECLSDFRADGATLSVAKASCGAY